MVNTVSVKIPTIGILGAGSGIATGTLVGEWTARSVGQTGYAALGVKAGVKGGISLLSYGASKKLGVEHDMASFFAEMFAYGCLGSVFLDVALALVPGGLPGLAEEFAMATRVMATGGRRVVRELSVIEETQKTSAGTPVVESGRWY